MSTTQSAAPDVSGIKVSVATVTAGVPSITPVAIGHIDSLGTIVGKTRNTTKYTAYNDTQYEEIVSMGSLTQDAFSMTVLYDPSGIEGINLIEAAIDDNVEVQIIIELNNSKGVTGTVIKQISKISSFKVSGEKDGKYKADFSGEKIGSPEVTPAS
jgi:hypothetical protein